MESSDSTAKKTRYDLEDEEDMDENKSSVNQNEITLEEDSDDEGRNMQKAIEEAIEEDVASVGETLAEGDTLIHKKDNEDQFSDCDVCHQSIRKSVFQFHRKSHISASKTTVECDMCNKMFSKKSMYKHKRRCRIMNMSRNVSGSENTPSVKSEQTSEQNFKCKICYTGFQKIDSLKWHTTKEHNLELEDVEQMLKENSDSEDVLQDDENRSTQSDENFQASVKLDQEILERVIKATEQDESKDDKIEEGDTKKYKCEHCDNEYTKKNNVRRHMRKHHPELYGKASI